MTLVDLLILIVLAALVQLLPIDGKLKNLFYIILVIVIVVWLLATAFPGSHLLHGPLFR